MPIAESFGEVEDGSGVVFFAMLVPLAVSLHCRI